MRLKLFFHDEVGVFGVMGMSSAGVESSWESCGKGSELRNACLVEVTSEARLDCIREDFRGGRVVREGVDWKGIVEERLMEPWVLVEVMELIESRRRADG